MHNTVFFKKAADRKTVYCLFAFFMMCCFFVFNPIETHAIKVGNSSGGIFGQTVMKNGVIYTPFTVRSVRYVRHTQFLTAEQDKPHAYKQASAGNGGPFTGFSYKCPGWYVTRAYSDNAGTNLLGYIRIYVAESDSQGGGCAAIAKPPAKPPTMNNNTVNVTHPNPNKVENNNMSTKAPAKGSNVPKDNGYPENEPPPKPKPANPKPVDPKPDPEEPLPGPGDGNVRPPIEEKPEPPVIEKPDPRTGPIPEEWQQHYLDQEAMCVARGGRYFIMDAFSNNPNYEMGCVNKPAWEQCNENFPCGNIIRPFKPYGQDPIPPSPENPDPSPEPEPEPVCEGPNDRCEYYEHVCEDGTDCEEMDFVPFEAEPGGGEVGGCEGVCEFFKCPGWDKFVGHLYDIADYAVGDVEPPPVPNLPKPDIPNIFDVLNKVDERNPAKPTGQEDPGLGTNTFNADDIKNGAGEIEFREDPTGGFNIVNPLDTLPDDGSEAPRPEEELETLPYPGGGGNLTEDGKTPSPSNSSNYDGKVETPNNPGGTAKPPTDTGGTVQQPTTDGTAKYPTIE